MKILLAGSSGQLAKEFIRFFESENIDYKAPEERIFDITDKEKISSVFSAYNPTHVINCAAYNFVDEAQKYPQKAFSLNSEAVKNLAEECNKKHAFFMHFSTDYVFDGTKNALYTEYDIPNPLNTYALSKLEGEKKAVISERCAIFRLSWVIGEGERNFLRKLKSWSKNGRTLKISADEVSVPTFTFDIVPACVKAVKEELQGVFHLTNSGYASRYELARLYLKRNKFDNIIVPVPMESSNSPAKRPAFTAMSNAMLSSKLNIQMPSWEQSLEKYCEKYDD